MGILMIKFMLVGYLLLLDEYAAEVVLLGVAVAYDAYRFIT